MTMTEVNHWIELRYIKTLLFPKYLNQSRYVTTYEQHINETQTNESSPVIRINFKVNRPRVEARQRNDLIFPIEIAAYYLPIWIQRHIGQIGRFFSIIHFAEDV